LISGQAENQDVEIFNPAGFWHRLLEIYGLSDIHGVGRLLATASGFTEATVSKWRRGDSKPSADNLCVIAKSTGVSIHWLLTGEGEKFVQPAQAKDVQVSALKQQISVKPLKDSLPVQAHVRKLIQIAGGVMTLHTIDAVAPMRMRDRDPDEVVAVALLDDRFVVDGYEIGDQLYCVPHLPEDTRDGDLIIARDNDQTILVRRFRQRGDHIVLEHRLRTGPALFYLSDEIEVLYRVVG
jgi:phage repressor protein C with HTH and peptisase S24 domain